MQNFAQQLSALRKERRITQEQLAQKLNVSRTTISRWESGKLLPDIENLRRLSQVLDHNFFTVEGLTAQSPAAPEETAPEETVPEEAPSMEQPPVRRGGKLWGVLGGVAAVLAICLALALGLKESPLPVQIVAAADKDAAYLEFDQNGELRWDVCFSFENVGDKPFTPVGADFICWENEAVAFEMSLTQEDLATYENGSTLARGSGALQIPFGVNMLNTTSVLCRLYGTDDKGASYEGSATVQLVAELLKTSEALAQAAPADPNAAFIVATADKEVAYPEPFFDGGFGWMVNFYFENLTSVPFRPDGVEVIFYENDVQYAVMSAPYEELAPHMSKGMLYKGGIPLHYPVGSTWFNLTHVYCHVYGTDDNGNSIDAGTTVVLSPEYSPAP